MEVWTCPNVLVMTFLFLLFAKWRGWDKGGGDSGGASEHPDTGGWLDVLGE